MATNLENIPSHLRPWSTIDDAELAKIKRLILMIEGFVTISDDEYPALYELAHSIKLP